jgi:nucleoid-associated protein YgaU
MTVTLDDVAVDAGVNAKIVPLMPPGIPVVFSFNPAKVTMTREAFVTERSNTSPQSGTPGGSSGTQARGASPRTLKFEALLEGPQTHTFAQQLLELLTPSGGLVGSIMALAGVNLAQRPPIVLFEWGPLTLLSSVKTCSVDYVRFHASGMPLRAKVNITLTEQKSFFSMLLTNPTSGGLPGRDQRVIGSGENLQHLSLDHYGRPDRWREIADTNDIDDPFRLRPGDVVYLPSPDESRRQARAEAERSSP